MIVGLLILVLLSVNLGGLASLVLQVGRGEWLAAAGTAVMLTVLNVLGFALLRDLRQR
ncbi:MULTISPECIES: hypothetical protein [Deinococcus]|uniref:Uncharacterized protein n=1 Tax=Deinococcus multiflagellatus TaxID=1656887 RepID=A0ABW1ZK10_9DEIO|nr:MULTISPECIES: hypothetical protein [Deinococcus]MBZ9711676.1 hypothetical protein [Deinococcus multiflagellatus]